MSNIKGDGWVQSLCDIFNALTILFPKDERLYLPHFNDLKIVNVYKAPGIEGDDWEQYLNNQGQLWIITPLHYLNDGSRNVRIASGGGRWNGRTCKLKKLGSISWYERKYNLVVRRNEHQDTEGGAGLQNYTMFEYSPVEIKPSHALCRITIYNKNNAPDRPILSSQQGEGKEIDHGNKGAKSQRLNEYKGGNFENATGYNNQQFLESQLRGLRKHYSDADIEEVFNRIKSEKLPDVSPKEHSTEAPVSKIRKRPHCTYADTMAGGTSTQRQELAKVEMLESNSYGGDTTNLHDDIGEQSSHHGNCDQKNAEQGSNPINLANFPEPSTFEELYDSSDDHENAVVWEPNQLSPNFIASSTEPMNNQNEIAPSPSTSIFATTEGRLDHQVQVQAPGPNTSNHSTIVPENIDSYNIFGGLTDLNYEDLNANRRSHGNGTIWDNLLWDENKTNWDW